MRVGGNSVTNGCQHQKILNSMKANPIYLDWHCRDAAMWLA